ncbi:MAG: MGMT family protein [Phycisphaerae bacterium]|jgi:O-6-methylguanine DNA methyltransferase
MSKTELKYVIFQTAWGFFGLLADGKGLLRVTLPMSDFKTAKRYLLVGTFSKTKQDLNLCPALQKSVTAYYKDSYVNFYKLKLALNWENLTDFYKKVLNVCIKIPLGQTITYSELAKRAGFPKAARAVGSVLAKNPLPLIIPCHRVIRSDGKIGNFSAAGGSKTKKKMLEHEKIIAAKTPGH